MRTYHECVRSVKREKELAMEALCEDRDAGSPFVIITNVRAKLPHATTQGPASLQH